MSDGTMHNRDMVRACKLYALKQVAKHCRGEISLTDIDGGLYVGHCRLQGGRALLVEFKTEGSDMSPAQQEALEFFVNVGAGRVGLVLAEHGNLDLVEPIADVTRFKLCLFHGGATKWTRWFNGQYFADVFKQFYGDTRAFDVIAAKHLQVEAAP